MLQIRLFFFFFLITASLVAQEQISLQNASFEGQAQDATVPVGWYACELGTTPDILPGFWGVYTEASEGDTYLGLITRDDGSFESIGQRLDKAMVKDDCYDFSVDLAHSDTYADYNLPLKIRIWAGTTSCQKQQLIAESTAIKHLAWKKYNFSFYAKGNYNYIIIEACSINGVYFDYKGNVLLDNISVIIRCQRA